MSTSAIHIAQIAALERRVLELERLLGVMESRMVEGNAKMDGVLYKLDKMPPVAQVITQTPRGPGRPRGK